MMSPKKILYALVILTLTYFICGAINLFAAQNKHILVIDPAHGGQDKGVGLTGEMAEKDITLAVALALKNDLAKENNLEIILTRDSDKEVSLKDRKKIIEKAKPEFVISLHTNAGFGKSASGYELYYSELTGDQEKEKKMSKENVQREKKSFNDSVRMAKIINENLNALFSRKGRGLRKADSPLVEDLFVPFVAVEMGFATNPEDKKKLISTKTQKEIAQALSRSIKAFFR